jgi:hypothetical protein
MMGDAPSLLIRSLLPCPRSARLVGGPFDLQPTTTISVSGPWEAPEQVALEALQAAGATHGIRFVAPAPNPARMGQAPTDAAQRYTLRLRPAHIDLSADTPAGIGYGLRTLTQLTLLCGRRWPALDIDDEPDFAVRGLSYDVSRGRVPTLSFLRELVDRLALLKVNQLQLYVEHTFAFAFDATIGADCSPLTPDEIRELDAYCTARRIELVPSLASFGHMGRILSLPQYQHLTEISPDRPWDQMPWLQRARGLTLDVTNPQSRALVERMYNEYLPLFSSRRVNVCCDETYDLGKGRGQARAAQLGPAGLFLEHVAWLRELCGRHGKQIMVWGDMLKKHPEMLPQLPPDVIVLDWGYDADMDYDSVHLFRDAGLTTYVCPGSSAWNRFFADLNTAEINIRGQAAAGRRHGCTGLLNTDWGNDGHVAAPGAAWHPLVLGAALGWNANGPTERAFDCAYAHLFLGAGGADAMSAWRTAVAASNIVRTWPLFYVPLRAPSSAAWPPFAGPRVPEDNERLSKFDDAALRRWQETASEAARAFAAIKPRDASAARDRDELVIAFMLHALTARRFLLERQPTAPAADLAAFAQTLECLIPLYETYWLARHKPSRLHEIIEVLRKLVSEARAESHA